MIDQSQPFTGLSFDVNAKHNAFTLALAFDVPLGATVAVVGPNGAGKSTLISVLAGFLSIEKGSIRVGQDVLDEPETGHFTAAEHRPIALVPQGGVLLPHMTVLANVAYGLRHRRPDLSRQDRELQARAALDDVGLTPFINRRPAELSGGQAQRAAVARALVLEAPVLLLDEPLSNIDVDNRQLIRKVLQVKRPADQIQIVVTHGRDHAHDADELLVLEDGRLAARGAPERLQANPPSQWLAQLLAP